MNSSISRVDSPVSVLYFGIQDLDYPRNRRIRDALGADDRFLVQTAPRSTAANRLQRIFRDLRALWRGAKGKDVLFLSEMSLSWAPPVWLVSRLRRNVVVVDGFVGLYETAIEDWRLNEPRSFRAFLYSAQDWCAVRSSRIYLIDTEVRARAIHETHSGNRLVISLPVGAPEWAKGTPQPDRGGPLRILYYGNYIPLHGLELVISALPQLQIIRDFELTLIGRGSQRDRIAKELDDSGQLERCRFVEPVPERDLKGYIDDADVVLGIFGESSKARTVIANKVWQGLASGRVVLTQKSPALEEIAKIVGGLLVTTTPGDPDSVARALAQSCPMLPDDQNLDVASDLERYVSSQHHQFANVLVDIISSERKR